MAVSLARRQRGPCRQSEGEGERLHTCRKKSTTTTAGRLTRAINAKGNKQRHVAPKHSYAKTWPNDYTSWPAVTRGVIQVHIQSYMHTLGVCTSGASMQGTTYTAATPKTPAKHCQCSDLVTLKSNMYTEQLAGAGFQARGTKNPDHTSRMLTRTSTNTEGLDPLKALHEAPYPLQLTGSMGKEQQAAPIPCPGTITQKQLQAQGEPPQTHLHTQMWMLPSPSFIKS